MNRRQWIGFVIFPAAIAGLLAFLFFIAKVDAFRQRTAPEAVVDLTDAGDRNLRWKAAQRLKQLVVEGKIEDRAAAVTALRAALKDAAPAVRFNAADALLSLEGEMAFPSVAGLLEDEDPDVRRVSAFLLGQHRALAAGPQLVKALDDAWEPVRWNAAVALSRLGDPSGRAVLHQMLRAPAPRSVGKAVDSVMPGRGDLPVEPDRAVHQNAIGALVLVGDATSITPLRGFIEAEVNPDLDDLVERAIAAIELRVQD